MKDLVGLFVTDVNGEAFNVADGLYAIASALDNVAHALKNLGIANASTPMGAIEILAFEIKEGLSGLGSSIYEGLKGDS